MEACSIYILRRKSLPMTHLMTFLALGIAALYCVIRWHYTFPSARSDNLHSASDYAPSERIYSPRLLRPEMLPDPKDDWLFTLPRFYYTLNNENVCNTGSDKKPFFICVVHSKPDHFRQRQVIRKTWSSHPSMRTVFLLGQSHNKVSNDEQDNDQDVQKDNRVGDKNDVNMNIQTGLFDGGTTPVGISASQMTRPIQSNNGNEIAAASPNWTLPSGVAAVTASAGHYPLDTQSLLYAEHTKYGDLIQGNFIDDYHNLTFKNIMGLKWVSRYCPNATYLLKSDDDAFIDVGQLNNFLNRTFPDGADQQTILCNVFPDGTTVLKEGKWAVTEKEYPHATYPAFCGGLAYLMTPELAKHLMRASQWVPFFWIDDVYVTGLLAQTIQAKHFYLNLRFTYKQQELVDWFSEMNTRPFPFLVAEIDTSFSNWRFLVEQLWNKTNT